MLVGTLAIASGGAWAQVVYHPTERNPAGHGAEPQARSAALSQRQPIRQNADDEQGGGRSGSWHSVGTARDGVNSGPGSGRGYERVRPIVRNNASTVGFSGSRYGSHTGGVFVIGGGTVNGLYNRWGFGSGYGYFGGHHGIYGGTYGTVVGLNPYGSYFFGDGYYPSNSRAFGGGAYYFVPDGSPRDWSPDERDGVDAPVPAPLTAIEQARLAWQDDEAAVAVAWYRAHLVEFPEDWAVLREAAIAMADAGELTLGASSIRHALRNDPELAGSAAGEYCGWSAGMLGRIVRRASRAGEMSGSVSDWLLAFEAERAMPRPRAAVLEGLLDRMFEAGLDAELLGALRDAVGLGDAGGLGDSVGG